MIYKRILRPILFSLDAEQAHEFVLQVLRLAQKVPFKKEILKRSYRFNHPSLKFDLLGKHFQSPVGLAAGFDKNCEIINILSSFGFGFVEGGTVTARAQEGNPKPRIFRIPEENALINRLGFNNRGADWVEKWLQDMDRPSIPVGINIGKSKITDNSRAAEDYLYSFEKLYTYADYFVVNVSSPNTPGLRELQHDLSPILATLQEKNDTLARNTHSPLKPIFVKIAPDLDFDQLNVIAEICADHKIVGLIATNTTIAREGVAEQMLSEGGLSGKPLEDRSMQTLRYLYKNFGKKFILIGVGGIFSAEDAYRKIRAGASLVQLYTGWIYGGPCTIKSINKGLVELLERDGFKNIQEAVGTEV